MTLVLSCFHQHLFAKDLIDVIPSLYGGDGVQLIGTTVGFNHAPHFEDEALQQLNSLTTAASNIQLAFPNASGGISFSYDPVLDEFVKAVDSHSLLFTDSSSTLGKGRFSGGITYSNINYDKINGRNLSNLTLALDHRDLAEPGSDICIGGPQPTCYLFEEDKVKLDVDLEFNSEVLFLFGAFGLTDHFDVEIILPIIKNRLSIRSRAKIQEHDSKEFFDGTVHEFDEQGIDGDGFRAYAKENKIGFGDLNIHGKWNFYNSSTFDLATVVDFLIPTGDQDNFMGRDTFSVKPIMILSTKNGIADIPINAHLNLGYEFSTGDGQNALSYAAALEYRHEFSNHIITTAFELIGEHTLETRTGFGDDQIDAAVGAKWSFMESQALFFNYRFPLNEDGLRASHIFSAGYAFTF